MEYSNFRVLLDDVIYAEIRSLLFKIFDKYKQLLLFANSYYQVDRKSTFAYYQRRVKDNLLLSPDFFTILLSRVLDFFSNYLWR